jgi:DNA polymerase III delta prime subunit
MDLENLIIPNKNTFESFFYKHVNQNDYNICISGPHYSCKSTICNLFIKEFMRENYNISDAKKIVFELNYYDEINIQNEINELTIFCNNNTNTDKLIYVNNFDYFNDNNQQLFKFYLDKYNGFKEKNKTYFLIECNNIHKLKDFIKSRLDIYITDSLTHSEKFRIFKTISYEKNITIQPGTLEQISQIQNLNINCWNNFLRKLDIIDISHINIEIFKKHFYLFDQCILKDFLTYIEQDNIHESIKILHDLYDDGYDICDILFYIYHYIKDNNITSFYCVVKIICKYINEVYNGFHNKLLFVFLVNDMKKLYHCTILS